MTKHIELWFHMIFIILVLLFAFLYSLVLLNDPKIYTIFKLIAIIVLIAVIYLGSNRNIYLPFLGYTIMPPSFFNKEITPQGATDTLTIKLNDIPNDTKIIYWAAISSDKDKIHPNPYLAYGDYSNAGVTTVKDNQAILYFHCPDKYNVGTFKKTLNKHIHYRLMKPNNPILSPVYTQYVEC